MSLPLPRPRRLHTALLAPLVVATGLWLGSSQPIQASTAPALLNPEQTQLVVQAREAWRRGQADTLARLQERAHAQQHPLAQWVDYWALRNRLSDATQADLNRFYARWPDTYLEDRLRNDWLLELGRRQDWRNYAVEYPKFVLKDDRQAACYWLLVEHQQGRDVAQDAREAWWAQRRVDEGCRLLAQRMTDAGVFSAPDIWRKARMEVDAANPDLAAVAVRLLDARAAAQVQALYKDPVAFLRRAENTDGPHGAELTVLALQRLAMRDHEAAFDEMLKRQDALGTERASWTWAAVGKWMGIRLSDRAPEAFQHAARGAREDQWLNNTLDWKVRAAIRAGRWQQAMQGINAMPGDQQAEPVWAYWKARALDALAETSQDGDDLRTSARQMWQAIASPLDYYGQLAADALGQDLRLPPAPPALTRAERAQAQANPGLRRALMLLEAGLRSEGVREWNYTIRELRSDRELRAAAAWACEREVWDRCIHTSERTFREVDLAQRYPMPFRQDVLARTREIDLDPAYVYGLIRQESRFVMDARSGAGASGLMQLMPATARYTARRLGIPFTPSQINERQTNIALGTGYLKLVLDDMGGSQALAAAAYNAGPNRPRRWRNGPVLDAAIWTENVPFTETRDYIQKVLANASVYSALLAGEPRIALRERLGLTVGPRGETEVAENQDLP